MYNVVRVVGKGKPGQNNGLLDSLANVNLPNDVLFYDKVENGRVFLVEENAMGKFLAEVRQVIAERCNGVVVGVTECNDNTYLVIVATNSNSLRVLDDERAQQLWK